MWKFPWNREDWVISRAGFRVLTVCFWTETALFFIFLSLAAVALKVERDFLTYLPLRIFFSLLGAAGVLSFFILDSAMRVFGDSLKQAGERTTSLWRFGWIYPVFGPPMLYFLLVYRRKMKESSFTRP